MIISHLKQSMPDLLINLRKGVPPAVLLAQLQEKTRGDWQGVKPGSAQLYGDYIAGAYEGRIASVYKITGHTYDDFPVSHRRVTFEVEAAPELGRLVGQPIPGGRWKRGEARPVRYLDTTDVIHFMDHELDLPKPDFDTAEELDAAMLDNLHEIASPRKPGPADGSLLDEIKIELNPRGGIVVSVPANTRVLIVPRA